MAKNSKIEWTDHTFNPWIGCTKISPACDNCYAEKDRAVSCLGVKWGAGQSRHRTSKNYWKQPLTWNKQAKESGKRIRVFCASLADVFDNEVPQEWRDDLWELMEETPYLIWIIVTKRIGNARSMFPYEWTRYTMPKNIWLLITVCNQRELNRDITKLFDLPASVRGLSIEPMLGKIDLCNTNCIVTYFDWVIVGGESGKNARPLHPDRVRLIRDQCNEFNVPFFFKQWGEWADSESANIVLSEIAKLEHHIFEIGIAPVYKVGKKRAGNLLDGQVWQQMPEVAQ